MPASSRLLLIFLSLLSWTCHSPSQDPRLPDLAIHHAMVLTMDAKMTVLERGNVLIKGGQIVAVLPDTGKEVPEALKMLDGTGKLLMPGLINTHTHAPMTLFRGLADDLDLKDWLEKHIWPAEARYMKPDVIRLGTKLAMAEMIRGGTTTFNDMYFFVDAMAEEVDQAGMRAILSEGLLDFPTPSFADPEAAMAE
ncbi:MAG: amidohydrolase family protein, partial [Bacteroidota bacterium]